jgi:hypothetical protein
MPTKRTPRGHRSKLRITDKVANAWHDCNFLALHTALNLTPWNHSPLPSKIDGLGVNPGPAPAYMDEFQRADWRNAQEMQRRLLAACGWPKNCGPPGACITPSNDTNAPVMTFLIICLPSLGACPAKAGSGFPCANPL